jgi:uncharacterized protein (UPF0332 family)
VALADELLDQAKFLFRREARRAIPRQAGLRRAASTAYYSVFHLLAAEAAAQAGPRNPRGLQDRLQRALDHATMKQAAGAFRGANLPQHVAALISAPLSQELIAVTDRFVLLQEARHKADYDLTEQFDGTRVQALISDAEQVFQLWNRIRDTDETRVFLSSLLFWKLWSR